MTPSDTHLVLIPSFNAGPLLLETVQGALAHWQPVWVVLDGSTDGSGAAVQEFARRCAGLRVIERTANGGKGAAVYTGATAAVTAGFTHALVMDADGQHPAERIRAFFAASQAQPDAMILGRPVFGPEAPAVRLQGRKISVGLVHFETLGQGIDDPLFGFRVYPLVPLLRVMEQTRGARRYDFDPAVAVRLFWSGTPAVNLPAACRYRSRAEGGVSHFNYVRDNVRMVRLHAQLLTEFLAWRWVQVRRLRRQRKVRNVSGG